MKVKKDVTIEKVDDVICDVCGKRCKGSCDIECATLAATWGYDSKRDGEVHECDMCEDCYEKVCQFIESLGGRINKGRVYNF